MAELAENIIILHGKLKTELAEMIHKKRKIEANYRKLKIML
jgi:hypothetical protein